MWKCGTTNSTHDFVDATIYSTSDCSGTGSLMRRALSGSKLCTSIGNNSYMKLTCQSDPVGSSLNKQQNVYDLSGCSGKVIGEVRSTAVCTAKSDCSGTTMGPVTFYFQTQCNAVFIGSLWLLLIFIFIF